MYSFMGEKRLRAQEIICKRIALVAIVAALAAGVTTSYAAGFAQANVSRETILPETTVLTTTGTTPKATFKTVYARITGFNTVPEQTDAKPCLAASGDDICGRSDVVACPRNLALGTKVEIYGKKYVCLDRTSGKYNGRFDISCDKDTDCPGKVTGHEWVKIYD
jgi:FlaG/FlaF family flagellin (archaellin)